MYHEVGVVIPYYHCDLKETEKISLEQCMKILRKYPIIFVVPDDMNETDYPAIPNVLFEVVPKEWLLSVVSYNQMMLRKEFYERFEEYKYILIYQLDAFVFSDRLMEMCQYGYDYIGAPWLEGFYYYVTAKRCIWRVGNGGFSLRNVRSVLKLLKMGEQKDFKLNEDIFYAISDSRDFRVAPLEIALKFSFEQQVEKCYQQNHSKLPFGCHAWERYNLEFWKPYIEANGYTINTDLVDRGRNDKALQKTYEQKREHAFFWEHVFTKEWFQRKLQELFQKQVKFYVVWGAGNYGQKLCRILKDTEVPVRCLIDQNSALIGERWGFEIKSINDVHFTEQDAVIVAIKEHGWEVAEILSEKGFVHGKDYVLLEDIQTVIDI